MTTEFNWPIRVYYEDTDAGGVVYHANYLRFYERARTEWLNQLQIKHVDMLASGIAFVVTKADIDYLKPATLNDELVVKSIITKTTPARIIFEQAIWRGESMINRAIIYVACLKTETFSPCRIPATIKEEFQRVS